MLTVRMRRGKSLVDSFIGALSNGSGCTVNTSCSCIGSPGSTQKPQRDRNSLEVQTHKALPVHYVLLPRTPSLPPLKMAVMVIGPSRRNMSATLKDLRQMTNCRGQGLGGKRWVSGGAQASENEDKGGLAAHLCKG